METVTLSADYRVQLPQSVCAALKITPGEEFRVLENHGHVELVPVRELREARGFLRGMNPRFEREDDRM